jgi:hypothetical protein
LHTALSSLKGFPGVFKRMFIPIHHLRAGTAVSNLKLKT